jgi:hypothetical protein
MTSALKERLNTAELEIPSVCPTCQQFVDRDVTYYYVCDSGDIVCSRCRHTEQMNVIASWEDLPEWFVFARREWRRLSAKYSPRRMGRRRREAQQWAWAFFRDCWKDPKAVARRVAELNEIHRWQTAIMAGLRDRKIVT